MMKPGWVLVGATAGLLSWLLFRFPPLTANDPFRTTLPVLPLVVAGFVALAGYTRRRRGAAPPRLREISPRGWGKGAALAVLVVLVLGRQHLGLGETAPVLAAGFLILLAVHLGDQLKALRPLLGRRLPSRPSWVFFLLPLLVYLTLLPWSTHHRPPDGDEPWYLLLTHSLAYDFDTDLANNYRNADWRHFLPRPIEPQPGDPEGEAGQIYSRHNALLPAVLAPAYRLGGKLGVLIMMAALTAAVAWTTLRLGRHYAPDAPGEALVAYSIVAFAPPLLLFSYQVWVEVPAALLAAAALDRVWELTAKPSPRIRDWGLAILPILLLPLLKLRFALLAASLLGVFLLFLLVGPGKAAGRGLARPVLTLGGLVAVLAAGVLVHNQVRYGNPLKMHSWQELELYRYPAVEYLQGLVGLFYDAAFGLFGAGPIWMLLLPAGLLLAARRPPLLLHLGVLCVPYLVLVASRREWYGGWSPPFRYPLVILPFLGLALIPLLKLRRRAGARGVLAVLGGLTLVLTVLWVVVPGWTYNLAHGRSHLLDHLEARLGGDLIRFFPSSVRPRLATWVWPAASLAAVSLAWWFPRRRLVPFLSSAMEWGAVGILCLAVLPVAATAVPTYTVEVESPWVQKSGGGPYPETWILDRRRFAEGWVLVPGQELTAAVVPGGTAVELTLRRRRLGVHPGPLELEVLVGEHVLGRDRIVAPSRSWEEKTFGPVSWPRGEPLVVRIVPSPEPGPVDGVVVDKVKLDWQ